MRATALHSLQGIKQFNEQVARMERMRGMRGQCFGKSDPRISLTHVGYNLQPAGLLSATYDFAAHRIFLPQEVLTGFYT
jgi:hypothetical protein